MPNSPIYTLENQTPAATYQNLVQYDNIDDPSGSLVTGMGVSIYSLDITSSYTVTASNAVTSSYALNISPTDTSSFAITASYALMANTLPYSASAVVLIPLVQTGSYYFATGSNGVAGVGGLLYIYNGLRWASCSLA